MIAIGLAQRRRRAGQRLEQRLQTRQARARSASSHARLSARSSIGHIRTVSVPRSVIGTVRNLWSTGSVRRFQRELDRQLDAEGTRTEAAASFAEVAVAIAQVAA